MANGDRKSNREGNGAENVKPIGIGCPEHGQDEHEWNGSLDEEAHQGCNILT